MDASQSVTLQDLMLLVHTDANNPNQCTGCGDMPVEWGVVLLDDGTFVAAAWCNKDDCQLDRQLERSDGRAITVPYPGSKPRVPLVMPPHTTSHLLDGSDTPCRGADLPGYVHAQADGKLHCNRCGWVTDNPAAVGP